VFIRLAIHGRRPEALAAACGLSVAARLVALTAVLGHRARDGIIQASIQRAKVISADGSVQFHRQFGDGLTDVAIVVHDLRHGKSLTQEVVAVLDRAPADRWARDLTETKRIPQLIQGHRNAVVDSPLCGRWNRPRGDFRSAPADDLVAIDGNEFVEYEHLGRRS
jgi:hypothetical protein